MTFSPLKKNKLTTIIINIIKIISYDLNITDIILSVIVNLFYSSLILTYAYINNTQSTLEMLYVRVLQTAV